MAPVAFLRRRPASFRASASKIMGHASVTTTEHYAHLKPDLFPEKDFDAITVDLSKPAGDVVSLPHSRPLGNTMTTEREDIAEQQIA